MHQSGLIGHRGLQALVKQRYKNGDLASAGDGHATHGWIRRYLPSAVERKHVGSGGRIRGAGVTVTVPSGCCV
jgi:hypothetical protein